MHGVIEGVVAAGCAVLWLYLLLCWCKRCGALWFEGPNGMVRLSQDELSRLRQVRASYVTGELRS